MAGINIEDLAVGGTVVVTSARVLQNVTANASIITAGSLPVARGGTGLTSWTAGDLPYYVSGTGLSQLSIGSSNRVLTSSGTAPQWSTSLSLAGTLAVTGLATIAKQKTGSGTTSVATASATTLFEAPQGLSEVWAYVDGAAGIAVARVGRNVGFQQQIASDISLTLTLSLSGANVQVTQSTGSTVSVKWAYRVISDV